MSPDWLSMYYPILCLVLSSGRFPGILNTTGWLPSEVGWWLSWKLGLVLCGTSCGLANVMVCFVSNSFCACFFGRPCSERFLVGDDSRPRRVSFFDNIGRFSCERIAFGDDSVLEPKSRPGDSPPIGAVFPVSPPATSVCLAVARTSGSSFLFFPCSFWKRWIFLVSPQFSNPAPHCLRRHGNISFMFCCLPLFDDGSVAH